MSHSDVWVRVRVMVRDGVRDRVRDRVRVRVGVRGRVEIDVDPLPPAPRSTAPCAPGTAPSSSDS